MSWGSGRAGGSHWFPRARPSLSLAGALVCPARGGTLALSPQPPLTRLFPAATPSPCSPDQFQCAPGAPCFPQDWRCDGHPDCEDDRDEWGCGSATTAEPSPDGAAVTPPRSSAEPLAGSAGTGPRGAGGIGEQHRSLCSPPSLADPGQLRSPQVTVGGGSAVGDPHLWCRSSGWNGNDAPQGSLRKGF